MWVTPLALVVAYLTIVWVPLFQKAKSYPAALGAQAAAGSARHRLLIGVPVDRELFAGADRSAVRGAGAGVEA
jgi:hypothetical protein